MTEGRWLIGYTDDRHRALFARARRKREAYKLRERLIRDGFKVLHGPFDAGFDFSPSIRYRKAGRWHKSV